MMAPLFFVKITKYIRLFKNIGLYLYNKTIGNMESNKILIGGKALNFHGSSRLTSDTDYMVFIEDNYKPFITDAEENMDYINGNGSNFFNEIWEKEEGNAVATPESLLELKAFSYVQHILNGNFHKINDTEFDIKFLVIKFKLDAPKIVKKYLSTSEYAEVIKFFESIRK